MNWIFLTGISLEVREEVEASSSVVDSAKIKKKKIESELYLASFETIAEHIFWGGQR